MKGLWESFFFELRGEIDTEWVFTDGSYVRAHQHASGARLGEERAIGKSRGGATTKIHIAADAHGNPIDFEITGGQVHDSQVACQIIEDQWGQVKLILAVSRGIFLFSISAFRRSFHPTRQLLLQCLFKLTAAKRPIFIGCLAKFSQQR